MTASDSFGNSVAIDPRRLADFLRSDSGPVVRMLLEDCETVRQGARRRVGVYDPPDSYSAANRERRPGTLLDSIVTRVREEDGLPIGFVGSDDPVAKVHHEGSEAHDIIAKNKPALVFYSRKAGHVVRTVMVRHPGTEPNPYLRDSLGDLRGRH